MNKLERLLIWFGGYSPRTLAEDPPEEREVIAKIGGAVLFATMVAFLNWGIAGWTYAAGIDPVTRLPIAALTASIGAFMAALFDRSFVYFADTSIEGERFKLFAYGAARIAIIVAIGSITSQAVMPLLLGSELKAQALHMTEAAEKNRVADLNTRYQVGQKESEIKIARKEVEALRLAASNLPPDIQKKVLAAKACWTDYGAQKAKLLSAGYSLVESQTKLTAKASYCSERSTLANAERTSYFSRIQSQLDHAVKDKQAKESEFAETESVIKSKVESAGLVEVESFNPRSSTVLWAMVKSNPGALGKWAVISFMLLVFELLPLILKFQAGQSNVGRRIATNRALRRFEMAERLKQSEHDFAISSAVSEISQIAVKEAMQNPAVRAIFAQAFAANISAFAPMEAVRAMMRDIEARHVDVSDFMHRYPRFAAIIGQAWSQAIKNTSEILSHGFGSSTAS